MSYIQAVVLGLVQGLAEFLPVSSSGHLILARALMGISDEAASAGAYMMLDILLHVGTLLAVLVVFWKDWWNILKNPFKSKTLLLLFIASVPALLVAVLFGDVLDQFFTGWFLGISFLLTGVFLLLAETVGSRRNSPKREVGFVQAIVMGVFQSIALLPGVSRSGSTLTGGLLSGTDRNKAAKFSFMMSAPAILGSLLVEGKHAIEEGYIAELDLYPTLVAIAVAAVAGFLAIRFMLRVIRRSSLCWFAIYVGLLGLVIILLQLSGAASMFGLPAFALPVL